MYFLPLKMKLMDVLYVIKEIFMTCTKNMTIVLISLQSISAGCKNDLLESCKI